MPPYSGDFNVQGGVYRDVRLFATRNTRVDTLDFGGPGVYATTKSASASLAEVNVRSQIRTAEKSDQQVRIRAALSDSRNRVVAVSDARRPRPPTAWRKWSSRSRSPTRTSGMARPIPTSRTLSVELRSTQGRLLDRVSFPFGIRTFKVDPGKGFFLNGKSYPALYGVATHPGLPGGWATKKRRHQLCRSESSRRSASHYA